MNKQRRKSLDFALEALSEIRSLVEDARNEEQEYFDNMPESFQSGDKGQAAEDAVSLLDDALNALDDVEGLISDAQA